MASLTRESLWTVVLLKAGDSEMVQNAQVSLKSEWLIRHDESTMLFFFKSPTEAIIAASEFFKDRSGENWGVMVIALNLYVSNSVYQGSDLPVLEEYCRLLEPGSGFVSRQAFGISKRSEVEHLVGPRKRILPTRLGKKEFLTIKRLETATTASELSRRSFRQCPPAPFPRRMLAYLFDYFLFSTIYLFLALLALSPEQLSVWLNRKVIQAEGLQGEASFERSSWQSSGGKVVVVGRGGSLGGVFPYETGRYKLVTGLIFEEDLLPETKKGGVLLALDGEVFDAKEYRSSKWTAEFRFSKLTSMSQGEVFELKNLSAFPVTVDFVRFVAENEPFDVTMHAGDHHLLIFPFDDFFRFLGRREDEGVAGSILACILYLPLFTVFIQCLFLSFVCWTPGMKLAGIRTVVVGSFTAPGYRAWLRLLAILISILSGMVGLVLPLLTGRETGETVPDMWSGTRVLDVEG